MTRANEYLGAVGAGAQTPPGLNEGGERYLVAHVFIGVLQPYALTPRLNNVGEVAIARIAHPGPFVSVTVTAP